MKPLSKAQLSVLGQLATKAHRHLLAVGVLDSSLPSDKYEPWRHEETAAECAGIASWRALNQSHYVPLCNRFRRILGLELMADRTPKTDEAALIWTLRDRLAHWEASPAYVAAIVRDKTGRAVTASMSWDEMFVGLSAVTLKHLIYTLERALRRKTKRLSDSLGIPAPEETHTSPSTMPPARLAEWRGDRLAERPQAARKPSASARQTNRKPTATR